MSRTLSVALALLLVALPAVAQSVGTNGLPAPGSSTQGGGTATDGTLKPMGMDANGVLLAPKADTSNRVVTKTAVTANTSTQICPAQANPEAVEITPSAAGGIGLQGQALTTDNFGTTSDTPDIVIGNAGTTYAPAVPPTNAITFFSQSSGTVICVRTNRQ